MVYIDVHSHMNMLEDIESVVARAKEKGVNKILAAGVDVETNTRALALAQQYPEVKACLGFYPTDVLKTTQEIIGEEIKRIEKEKDNVEAISEIGLDLKEIETLEEQEKAFRNFVELAKRIDKPVIVHSRKAEKECIEILEEMKAKKVVMHCFSGNFKLVKRITENKWYFSIPTCVVHAQHFQKIIEETPIEQLLCETDSPYLHPDKEFPNEPGNVIRSYEMIAKIKGMKLEDVEKQIEKNYEKLVKTN